MHTFIKSELTEEYGFRIRHAFYAGSKRFPFHYDRSSRITLVLSGGVQEIVGNKEEFGKPLSVLIKPCDALHSNTFHPKGARLLSIEWNADQAPPILSEFFLTNWQWQHQLPQAKAATIFLQQLHQAASAAAIEESVVDLVANLTPLKPLNYKQPPLWLQQIAEHLQDEYQNQIVVQQLAQEQGVHPVYLARIFRRFYHCSIKEYLHQIRIQQTVHQLTTNDISIAHLAFDNGFADQSHLNRLFKKEMNLAPGQFRKLIQEVSFVQD